MIMANQNEFSDSKECIWKDLSAKHCLKCIARLLCNSWKIITSNDVEIVNFLCQRYAIDSSWVFCSSASSKNSTNQLNNIGICHTCSNILSAAFVNHCADLIKNGLQEKKYEFSSFQLLVSMPFSIIVQEEASSNSLKKKLGLENIEEKPFGIKEIFKVRLFYLHQFMLKPCLKVYLYFWYW